MNVSPNTSKASMTNLFECQVFKYLAYLLEARYGKVSTQKIIIAFTMKAIIPDFGLF